MLYLLSENVSHTVVQKCLVLEVLEAQVTSFLTFCGPKTTKWKYSLQNICEKSVSPAET